MTVAARIFAAPLTALVGIVPVHALGAALDFSASGGGSQNLSSIVQAPSELQSDLLEHITPPVVIACEVSDERTSKGVILSGQQRPPKKKPSSKPKEEKTKGKKTEGKETKEKVPVRKKPVDKKPADKKPAEKKPAEKKPAGKGPLEKKKLDPKELKKAGAQGNSGGEVIGPLNVFADIEAGWKRENVKGILQHFGKNKVAISIGGSGPSGGRFSKSQSYYLLNDLFKYTITKKFEFVQYRNMDSGKRKVFAVAERYYKRTDDGRLFKDKIYVSLHLEGDHWVIDEIKSIR